MHLCLHLFLQGIPLYTPSLANDLLRCQGTASSHSLPFSSSSKLFINVVCAYQTTDDSRKWVAGGGGKGAWLGVRLTTYFNILLLAVVRFLFSFIGKTLRTAARVAQGKVCHIEIYIHIYIVYIPYKYIYIYCMCACSLFSCRQSLGIVRHEYRSR